MNSIAIAAGGTGGHIFPALAVAHLLQAQGWHIHWVGAGSDLEKRVIPAEFDLQFLQFAGVRRNGWRRKLQLPFALTKATFSAKQLLRRWQVDAVLAMGGYVSAPVGLAAAWQRIPLIIHEQNAIVGMANKLLANMASAAYQAFPNTFAERHHAQTIGNPVRNEIFAITAPEQHYQSQERPLRVLVFGGSQGARFLNDTMQQLIVNAKPANMDFWLQTGAKDYASIKTFYAAHNVQNVRIQDFIEDMARAYEWADVIIGRAGALSVSEIAAAGRAAILIPLPGAVDDHQYYNAQYLAEQKAAIVLRQTQVTAATLHDQLKYFNHNRALLEQMGVAAKRLSHPEATAALIEACINAAKQHCKAAE